MRTEHRYEISETDPIDEAVRRNVIRRRIIRKRDERRKQKRYDRKKRYEDDARRDSDHRKRTLRNIVARFAKRRKFIEFYYFFGIFFCRFYIVCIGDEKNRKDDEAKQAVYHHKDRMVGVFRYRRRLRRTERNQACDRGNDGASEKRAMSLRSASGCGRMFANGASVVIFVEQFHFAVCERRFCRRFGKFAIVFCGRRGVTVYEFFSGTVDFIGIGIVRFIRKLRLKIIDCGIDFIDKTENRIFDGIGIIPIDRSEKAGNKIVEMILHRSAECGIFLFVIAYNGTAPRLHAVLHIGADFFFARKHDLRKVRPVVRFEIIDHLDGIGSALHIFVGALIFRYDFFCTEDNAAKYDNFKERKDDTAQVLF